MKTLDEAVVVGRIDETRSRRRFPWWAVVLLALVTGFVYDRTLIKLVLDWWKDPNFSHGFLVPLFSGWIVWKERKRLSLIALRPSWLGMLVIVFSLATLVVGALGAELFLARVSFVFLLAGVVIYLLGWEFFRALLFPWAFLFLMIPIPALIFNQITLPLQLLASQVASSILPLLGVPVLREGNVIVLPAMPLEVAEACSGIRSLMSLGALAIIYGYLLEPRNLIRVLLLIAAIPIAVAANALRVVGTGLCVQYWDPVKALGFFHEFSGWVIFIVAFALLVLVHRALQLPDRLRTRGRTS